MCTLCFALITLSEEKTDDVIWQTRKTTLLLNKKSTVLDLSITK